MPQRDTHPRSLPDLERQLIGWRDDPGKDPSPVTTIYVRNGMRQQTRIMHSKVVRGPKVLIIINHDHDDECAENIKHRSVITYLVKNAHQKVSINFEGNPILYRKTYELLAKRGSLAALAF